MGFFLRSKRIVTIDVRAPKFDWLTILKNQVLAPHLYKAMFSCRRIQPILEIKIFSLVIVVWLKWEPCCILTPARRTLADDVKH